MLLHFFFYFLGYVDPMKALLFTLPNSEMEEVLERYFGKVPKPLNQQFPTRKSKAEAFEVYQTRRKIKKTSLFPPGLFLCLLRILWMPFVYSVVFCLVLLWLPLGTDVVILVLTQVKSDQVILNNMFQCKSKMSYFAEQLTIHTASSLVMPIHNPASLSLVWPFASKSSSWCLNIVYLFFKSFSQNSFYQSSSCFGNFYLFTLQKLSSLPFSPTGKATRPVVATLHEGLILVQYAKNRCVVIKANAKNSVVNLS